MFKDIIDGIKEDAKEDIDLFTGKDVRPYGEYDRFERNKLGVVATVKSLKASWDKMGREQEEARKAQELMQNTEKSFLQKVKDFYARNKRGLVSSFYVGLTCVALGAQVVPFVYQTQNALPEARGYEVVTEKPDFVQEQEKLEEMEQPVVTIDEQGNSTITDKATEHEEFKAELQEGVVQEEELTQEQLEERAEVNKEKAIENSQVKESQEIQTNDMVK